MNILFSSYILKVPFENYSEDGIIYVWIGRYFSLTLCWMVCFHCFVLSLKLTWMFLLNKQQSLRKWSWSCQGTWKWNLGCKSENFSNLDLIRTHSTERSWFWEIFVMLTCPCYWSLPLTNRLPVVAHVNFVFCYICLLWFYFFLVCILEWLHSSNCQWRRWTRELLLGGSWRKERLW